MLKKKSFQHPFGNMITKERKSFTKEEKEIISIAIQKRYKIGYKVNQKPAFDDQGNHQTITNDNVVFGEWKNFITAVIGTVVVWNSKNDLFAPIVK